MNNQDQACIVWSQTYSAVLAGLVYGVKGDWEKARYVAEREAREAVRRWEAAQVQTPVPPVPVHQHDLNRPPRGIGGRPGIDY